jgi:hypothetical protein
MKMHAEAGGRMKRPISPRAHGVLDYATVVATAAAPRIFGFPEQAARLCYGLAGSYLGLSMLTDYPLSVKRAVPFKAHGATEAVLGAALPALPKALGFSDHRAARNFLFGLTALTFVVASLTDWK